MIMTLDNWQAQLTAKGLSHNDTVRLLQDAQEQIERLQNELHEQVRAWSILVNRAEVERDRLMSLLESLTPGGSEYHQSPDVCVAFVRDRLASVTKQVMKRKEAEAERDALRAALRELTEGYRLMVNADNPLKRAAMGEFMDMAVIRVEKMLGEVKE